MNRKLKITIFVLALVGVLGFVGYNYVMHGGERDIETEKTDFSISSKQISEEFSSKTDESNKKYLEKAIAIKGKITSNKGTELIIDNIIICSLKTVNSDIKVGDFVVTKGRFVGYDDLMGELKLDQCFIIKPTK